MLEFFKSKVNIKVWESAACAGVVFGCGLFMGAFGFYAGLVILAAALVTGFWAFYLRHR